MRFNVPITKDAQFTQDVFQVMSDYLSELREEAGKWPNRITFTGSIGHEVYLFIVEKGWDFKAFNPTSTNGAGADKIIFDFSKPLTQIEDRGATMFDDGFNNRQIKGIPGPATMQKIIAAYSAPAFKIERTIRPKIEILLTRPR